MYAMFVCNVWMQCMYGMHVRNVCMHVCMQWFAMQCYVMAMSMSVSVSLSVSLSVSMSCHVMYVYIYIYLYLDTRYICTRPCHPPSPPHGMGPIYWPHMRSSPSPPCGVIYFVLRVYTMLSCMLTCTLNSYLSCALRMAQD